MGEDNTMMEDFVMPNDKVRFFEYEGKKFVLTVTDPYGMWYIKYERGEVPEELKGSYTSQKQAETHIVSYMNKRLQEEERLEGVRKERKDKRLNG